MREANWRDSVWVPPVPVHVPIYMCSSRSRPKRPDRSVWCALSCNVHWLALGNGCMFAANDSQPAKTLPPDARMGAVIATPQSYIPKWACLAKIKYGLHRERKRKHPCLTTCISCNSTSTSCDGWWCSSRGRHPLPRETAWIAEAIGATNELSHVFVLQISAAAIPAECGYKSLTRCPDLDETTSKNCKAVKPALIILMLLLIINI